jgi:hypothetical protein
MHLLRVYYLFSFNCVLYNTRTANLEFSFDHEVVKSSVQKEIMFTLTKSFWDYSLLGCEWHGVVWHIGTSILEEPGSTLKVKVAGSSWVLVSLFQTSQHHVSEHCTLNFKSCDNFKFCMYPPISESRAFDIKQGFANYQEGSTIWVKINNFSERDC